MYVNALTESERLNHSEYRSETCSEAELIVAYRTTYNKPESIIANDRRLLMFKDVYYAES